MGREGVRGKKRIYKNQIYIKGNLGSGLEWRMEEVFIKKGTGGGKKRDIRRKKRVQIIENENSSSKLGSQAGQTGNERVSGVRETRTHDSSSKEREKGINIENEGNLVRVQCELRGRKKACKWDWGLHAAAQGGKKDEGKNIEMTRKRVDKSAGGVLIELDQNREGPIGMCLEDRKHGSWKRRAPATKAKSEKRK